MTEQYYTANSISVAAVRRLPGYEAAVAKAARPHIVNGQLLGYWLSDENALSISREFNPTDKERIRLAEDTVTASKVPGDTFVRWRNVFYDPTQACALPGCEELRSRYNQELSQLRVGCSQCEIGAVKEKYNVRLRLLISAATGAA